MIADLEIRGGQLWDVKLSGDFFLEPDTALAQMDAALEGLPAETGEADLAARVERAVGGAELIGITPLGVAIAVRRAIEGAAR